jgi:hypothetical protein
LHNGIAMSDVSNSDTPLKATFRIKLNGKTVAIETVGQAYAFITSLNTVEWMEFQSLHGDVKAAQATDLLRALFVRAKLL